VIEKDLEDGLRSFGRGFTVLEQDLSEELATELAQAEKVLAKVGVGHISSSFLMAQRPPHLMVHGLCLAIRLAHTVPGMHPWQQHFQPCGFRTHRDHQMYCGSSMMAAL